MHDALDGGQEPLSDIASALASVPSQLFEAFPSWYFGESGLKLPPVLHYGPLLKASRKNGMWRRHLSEYEYAATLGPIFCIFTPGQGEEGFPLAVMVSDPALVEQVMTDKDTFPSRGPNGFDSMLKEGLVALATGKKNYLTPRKL